jgi:hypothetical protein
LHFLTRFARIALPHCTKVTALILSNSLELAISAG